MKTQKNMIAYCFHSVDGFSKVGQYISNNSADGTFSYTGFRLIYFLIKRTQSASANGLSMTIKEIHTIRCNLYLFPNTDGW